MIIVKNHDVYVDFGQYLGSNWHCLRNGRRRKVSASVTAERKNVWSRTASSRRLFHQNRHVRFVVSDVKQGHKSQGQGHSHMLPQHCQCQTTHNVWINIIFTKLSSTRNLLTMANSDWTVTQWWAIIVKPNSYMLLLIYCSFTASAKEGQSKHLTREAKTKAKTKA